MKKAILWLLIFCLLTSAFAGCSAATSTASNGETILTSAPTATTVAVDYKITFDPNHDGISASVSEFTGGEPISARFPQRFGYSFSGWFLDAAGTTALPTGAVADQDLTLFAGWTAWDEATQGYMNDYKSEMDYAKYICNRPTAFEETTFNAYYQRYISLWLAVESRKYVINDVSIQAVYALRAARQALVQPVANPEDVCYYIWGGKMAVEDSIVGKEFYGTFDNRDFQPFLVKYMVPDQATVKGNIIVIAGGDFAMRNNYGEAYKAASSFRAMGYNAFVLQRRVKPYASVDSALDLQRSIRYLRYHAAEFGIAKTENMVACGFSDGGSTITFTVENLYGNIQPTAVYPNYVPDEVDQVSSDLSAMLIIYGGSGALETKNTNIPSAFIAVGSQDHTTAIPNSIGLYNFVDASGRNAEMHIFAGAPHDFGLGDGIPGYYKGYVGVDQWSKLANTFLDVEFGYLARTY